MPAFAPLRTSLWAKPATVTRSHRQSERLTVEVGSFAARAIALGAEPAARTRPELLFSASAEDSWTVATLSIPNPDGVNCEL